MISDLKPGMKFPDYELPDYTGKNHRLSLLQKNNPMLLLLSRGGYCPKDFHQHRHIADMEIEFRIGYSEIVTISTDNFLETREWRDKLGVSWAFLCDTERIVQKDLGIQEYTDDHNDPMIPHTVLLEPGLIVYKIYMGYWYWLRPTPEEIRQDMRELTKRCRPDIDLLKPGFREKWEAGDRDMFWPYGEDFLKKP